MIKRGFLFIIGIALSIVLSSWFNIHSPAMAKETRLITWNDLIPEVEFDDPFAKLTEEQIYDLSIVARYRQLRQQDKLEPGSLNEREEAELIASLEDQGIDIEWLLSQRERVAKARAQQANSSSNLTGKRIKIPGYALPLTHTKNDLTEFLLVPWVGACIHTPPPPPNQIIHVMFPEGTTPRDRFSPVWIEGNLENSPDDYTLYLVDGSREIRANYTLVADIVSDYLPNESEELSKVTIPDEIMTGQHGLQRWQSKISLLLTKAMADIKGQRFSQALLVCLSIAFLYGILHTLGPGHGKVVILSYFVGKGGSLRRGIWMGIRIAVLHVFAAIVLVLITDVIVRQVGGSTAANFKIIRLISYGGIACIGGGMLWQSFQDYKHFFSLPKTVLYQSQKSTSADAILYPRLTDKIFDNQQLNSVQDNKINAWRCNCFNFFERKGIDGWLSVAIGSTPCSGALLVLLYGLANDLLNLSIAMVMAISLGMAITLSGIGVFAIMTRQTLDKRLGENIHQGKISSALRLIGAMIIFLTGSSLFMFIAMSS